MLLRAAFFLFCHSCGKTEKRPRAEALADLRATMSSLDEHEVQKAWLGAGAKAPEERPPPPADRASCDWQRHSCAGLTGNGIGAPTECRETQQYGSVGIDA